MILATLRYQNLINLTKNLPYKLIVNNSNIKLAVKALNEGNLISFPTETVYGLGGDATNDLAIAKIFETKNRPKFNPLIIHFSSFDQI